ncbi:MAG: tetratricopeptide repeat protein [Halothece sp. Uz-M2-17]|nr:tetratricopeptide repeat protein [Halothece sp. Uz-M2-17]
MIREQVKQFIVFINSEYNSGSGVLVKQEGNQYSVLTAAHVVSKYQSTDEVYAVTFDEKSHLISCHTIRSFPDVDLALIQFTSEKDYPVAAIAQNPPQQGETIYACGFSDSSATSSQKTEDLSFLFNEGRIKASTRELVKYGLGLLYSSQTYSGMSGGAIVNEQGELLGINASRKTNSQDITLEDDFSMWNFSSGIPIYHYLTWVQEDKNITLPKTVRELTAEDYFVRAWAKFDYNSSFSDLKNIISDFTGAINLNIDETLLSIAYLKRGLAFSYQKQFQKAIKDYNQVLALNPNSVQAYFYRGLTYSQQKQFQKAIKSYNQALTLKSNIANIYYNRASAHLAKGNLYQAIQDCNQAIKIAPDWASPYGQKGFIYIKQRNWKKALANYNKAIHLQADWADAYIYRALIYLRQKKYQQSFEDYNQAIYFKSDSVEAYLDRAIVRINLNGLNDQKYFEDFKQGISLWRKQAKTKIFNYPVVFLRETAFVCFGCLMFILIKFLRFFENYLKSDIIRGNEYYDQRDFEKAIQYYNKAIRRDKNNSIPYNNRGNARRSQGDLEAAIEDYTTAISLNPNYTLAYSNRGMAYIAQENLEAAIADYTQAITLDSKNAKAYYYRGYAYYQKRNIQAARNDYEKAVALNPDYQEMSYIKN